MTNIELTKDQEVKLLEMCKKLFPEWTFITFQESAIMGAGWDYDFNNICFSKKSETLFDIEINIHWFEFCMTHLYDKLVKLNFNNRLFLLNILDKETDMHIIDYLYEEFKKLK